jgi:Carboxypeptidase regulatory-like domain
MIATVEGSLMRFHWLASGALFLTTVSLLGLPILWPSEPVVGVTKVSGLVTDNVGASLPKATVTFKAKRLEKKAVAADDGHYELDLPVGKYDVIARLQGCKDFRLKGWNAQSKTSNTLNMSLYCPPTPIY